MHNLALLPNQFLELLKVEHLEIAGVSIGGDLAKIGRDFRHNNATKTLKDVTNLGSFTQKRNFMPSSIVKLKTLVFIVLKEDLNKNDNIRLPNWLSADLS